MWWRIFDDTSCSSPLIASLFLWFISQFPFCLCHPQHYSIPPQKIYQYQCSSQLWIARSVEVSMVPLSHSLGQEPHQASVVLSYCCVGFCLPSLPVCGLPAQLIHHHPTVHLPHCLKAESFNQARVPCCSERVIITLASLIILEAVLICVFSQRIVVPTKKVQRS